MYVLDSVTGPAVPCRYSKVPVGRPAVQDVSANTGVIETRTDTVMTSIDNVIFSGLLHEFKVGLHLPIDSWHYAV